MTDSKVALVTGGGSGIGRATALALARDGFRIGVLGDAAAENEETVADIARGGGISVSLAADVSDDGAAGDGRTVGA